MNEKKVERFSDIGVLPLQLYFPETSILNLKRDLLPMRVEVLGGW
jgi:hypothetical protein